MQPQSPAEFNHLRWPTSSWLGKLAPLLNKTYVRRTVRPLPIPQLVSDITDVVYLNWLVPLKRVQAWLPAPLACAEFEGLTPLSILTYRHGHFGPIQAGALRQALCLSPLQSNWRLYLPGDPPAIYFFKVVLSSRLYLWGARLFSDGLSGHLPLHFSHRHQGATLTTRIQPGNGSAPDLDVSVTKCFEHTLPEVFAKTFGSWQQALEYLVPQQQALTATLDHQSYCEARISLAIPLSNVQPVTITSPVISRWLATVVQDCEPWAFMVPQVQLITHGERVIATSS